MKLIVFVDGSPYTASVCDYATWAAKRLDAEVELLHVLGRRERSSAPPDLSGNLKLGARSSLLQDLAKADEEQAKLAQSRGRLILDEAKARLENAGVTKVSTRLRHDDIVDTVREFEHDADLIMIGKRGEAHGFALDHLGSNLERIMRTATKPVMVANRSHHEIERYMIAFDGGPSVIKAIDHIAQGELFKDIPCHMLQVGQDNADNRARLEGAAAKLREAGREVEISLRPGEPDKVISEAVESEGSDMLVMGAYGHSRIRNFIIGSTTSEMVRSCKVPVLMFR